MLSVELLRFYRAISQSLFTVVDVETTGCIPTQNRVMEIAVVQATLEDGVVQQTGDLINPYTPIPANIQHITGIHQSMVDTALSAAEVLPTYWPLLTTGILTAHNLEFDYPFLRAEFARLGTAFVRPADQQCCTLLLARLMLSDLPSRSLPKLVRHFKFQVETSHRAEADALACWLLAKRLLKEICNEDDDRVLARFVKQWMPLPDVAQLLQCSPKIARSRLIEAGVEGRTVGRGTRATTMFRRGDVEQFFYDHQDGHQLSWI